VLEAEGRVSSTRSGLFPQLGAQGEATRTGLDAPVQSKHGGFITASWEIDLFGKLRSATEAARADLLATQENQKAVMQTLIADMAIAYFNLRELDAELVYVQESIQTRQASFRLVSARVEGGVASKLEADQAQSLVASAQATLAQIQRAIEQTENLINFLIGKQPGPVNRGLALTAQYQPPQVPAGLPSLLLDRRPDVRIAEQQLVAANARVGVAKAAFFPSISLTASGGYQTADLLGVINRAGSAYALSGAVDIPIFDAGRRAGNYKSAKAQRDALIINYQRAVNGAFRDASDSLIGYAKAREYRASQELFANTLRDQSRLANLRYRGGVSSYLEVLDTERQRLAAEQQLAQAQRDELTSLVQLYKALGGGWQP
jgi:multidrug efflux system outer membrane protein